MKLFTGTRLHFLAMIALSILLSACATTPSDPDPVVETTPVMEDPTPFSQFNSTTPEDAVSKDNIALGLLIRAMNKDSHLSLVLMNGLENFRIPKTMLEGKSHQEQLDHILLTYSLTQFETEHYTFIAAPAYEVLSTLDIEHSLSAKYANTKVNVALGADTPLFSALAMISYSAGLTLVADQVIGDAPCGELMLNDTPLPQALEALLQSARIQPAAIKIRSTDDYILFHSTSHTLRTKVASGPMSTTMASHLKENTSVSLMFYTPSGSHVTSPLGASKLHTVLSELSLQLGIQVKAEGKVNHLPVNPMVLNNVSRETALELVIHQWMLPIFAYEESDGSIVLKHAGNE